MRTVCNKNMCAGCMACIDICPTSSITINDDLSAYNAVIEEKSCINCGACERVCQANHPSELMPTVYYKQGWADQKIREISSSGGFATAITRAFIRNGGYVASCRFVDGQFNFFITNEIEKANEFIGSKYVKSNPVGIYKSIKEKLKQDEKVLFVGLPCQVSSLRNYVKSVSTGKLYTIDLICHGTPSPALLNKALLEYGYDLEELRELHFRKHNKFGLRTSSGKVTHEKVRDRYLLAFLNGLFYTENCYSCKYATQNRVGDLTLGDSWGTDLATEESNGISLALMQNEKGKELLNIAELKLFDVDYEKACAANHQLIAPSKIPTQRKEFFANINHGMKFKKAVAIAYPKSCRRQDIKEFLIRYKLFK